MKSFLFLIVAFTFSLTAFAGRSYTYVERDAVYKVVRMSPSLMNSITAYNLTHGFSKVKSVSVSKITVERTERGHAEEGDVKYHTCEWTTTAELENGGKLHAVEEHSGECQ